ncbi:hypothetical protein [Pseudomonas fitomaticsae]|uniref:Uncharacterized protein n=1 Tax=Pseudomonas fitomaticsae TaxID=2837969 RepID=A0ABY3PWE8_9PSED|nr:hypothetical protein [Pseudomonas fitomaticsae]UFP98024.1 hypothetical protein KJY40_18405 [Pseudomonas fitomaticsae]
MEHKNISLLISGVREEATIKYDSKKGTIKFAMKNGFKKMYEADDLYLCLAKIRNDFPDIVFLCKGAKINVTPSRMCSQMSGGAVAYELTLGKPATFNDIVQIFDYEESDLSTNLKDQQAFYKKWIDSLKKQAQ